MAAPVLLMCWWAAAVVLLATSSALGGWGAAESFFERSQRTHLTGEAASLPNGISEVKWLRVAPSNVSCTPVPKQSPGVSQAKLLHSDNATSLSRC